MYRWTTIPSCRFSHYYCWWNFKISHRKQPRPLADACVNFEGPAQVSISGDCIAIIWRHLIFFCFFTAPAESWINGAFHSDDNHAVFPIMTTVTSSPKSQPADLKLSVESHAVTHRLTLPEVGNPRNIAQHWQLDLWNWEHISQTYRIHVEHAIGNFKSFRLLSGILPFSMVPLLISSVMLTPLFRDLFNIYMKWVVILHFIFTSLRYWICIFLNSTQALTYFGQLCHMTTCHMTGTEIWVKMCSGNGFLSDV